MGNFRSLPHVRHRYSTAQARVEASASAMFPSGDGKFYHERTHPAAVLLVIEEDVIVTVPEET